MCSVMVEVWSTTIHIEHWVQTKEWWNVELESIVPYNLSDGVRPILEWEKLAVGPSEALLLQMQPNFVAHLELVWHLVLIMTMLVLSIGSIQYVLYILEDVLNVLNEAISHVSFRLNMSQICWSSYKWNGHINGT